MFVALLALLALLALPACGAEIEHFVAVMFENRAFDHVLGHLKATNPNVNGLTGSESNPLDPANPQLGSQRVSFDATDVMQFDPGHSIQATEIELWGQRDRMLDPAPMNGFLKELLADVGAAEARHVMRCFNATSASVISSLASQFAVFDGWHASIPGPTMPNRVFALSGTSRGVALNSLATEFLHGFSQQSIFDDLVAAGLDYRVYFGDFPTALVLDGVARRPWNLRPIQSFGADARAGTLPSFSFVEPRYFSFADFDEEDQHPTGTIGVGDGAFSGGERFLKWVYEELRASPQWNKTALLVYYDEHGGLFDHVSPPQKGVPNPDGRNSTNPPFNFDRLGLRVPAVLVSPAVAQGSILRARAGKHFEHTSLLATMRRMLPLTQRPLSAREAWADSFENVFTSAARTASHPMRVELQSDRGDPSKHARYVERVMADDGSDVAYALAAKRSPDRVAAQRKAPLHDLQRDLLWGALARAAPHDLEDAKREFAAASENMADAATYVRRRMSKLLEASASAKK
jgi:phospholipase C